MSFSWAVWQTVPAGASMSGQANPRVSADVHRRVFLANAYCVARPSMSRVCSHRCPGRSREHERCRAQRRKQRVGCNPLPICQREAPNPNLELLPVVPYVRRKVDPCAPTAASCCNTSPGLRRPLGVTVHRSQFLIGFLGLLDHPPGEVARCGCHEPPALALIASGSRKVPKSDDTGPATRWAPSAITGSNAGTRPGVNALAICGED